MDTQNQIAPHVTQYQNSRRDGQIPNMLATFAGRASAAMTELSGIVHSNLHHHLANTRDGNENTLDDKNFRKVEEALDMLHHVHFKLHQENLPQEFIGLLSKRSFIPPLCFFRDGPRRRLTLAFLEPTSNPNNHRRSRAGFMASHRWCSK
jgi:hypothetical protein